MRDNLHERALSNIEQSVKRHAVPLRRDQDIHVDNEHLCTILVHTDISLIVASEYEDLHTYVGYRELCPVQDVFILADLVKVGKASFTP